MSVISKPFTWSAGATIIASEHNSNWDTLLADYNGNITNSNIAGGAAITYSKLSLASGIVNADISASAAIVASKLNLTSPGAIGSTNKNTGAFSILTLGTTNRGDILYDNGTSLRRMAPGTSGYYLKSQGSGADPLYAALGITKNTDYSFSAYNSANQNSVTDADVDWDTEDFDTGGNFASSIFTAPVTGKYCFSCNLQVVPSNGTTYGELRIHKNGAQFSVLDSSSSVNTSVGGGVSGAIVMSLTALDTVNIHFTRTAGAGNFALNHSSTLSRFTGFYLT